MYMCMNGMRDAIMGCGRGPNFSASTVAVHVPWLCSSISDEVECGNEDLLQQVSGGVAQQLWGAAALHCLAQELSCRAAYLIITMAAEIEEQTRKVTLTQLAGDIWEKHVMTNSGDP